MEWVYAELVNGRLIDSERGGELNENWPSFESREEAEAYLEDEDIRATIR